MNWILLVVMLAADGTPTELRFSRPTEKACNELGQAIVAQVNHERSSVAGFSCDPERPPEERRPEGLSQRAWMAGALPFGR
jgi:hypothetical protein